MLNLNSEAIFYSASYTTASGWKIVLQCPDDLLAMQLNDIGAGKRYMVALVPITDQETPDEAAVEKVKSETKMTPAQYAGMLCNVFKFQEYMGCVEGMDRIGRAALTIEGVRDVCGIKSRADIKEGTEANEKFQALLTDYDVWRGRIAGPRE